MTATWTPQAKVAVALPGERPPIARAIEHAQARGIDVTHWSRGDALAYGARECPEDAKSLRRKLDEVCSDGLVLSRGLKALQKERDAERQRADGAEATLAALRKTLRFERKHFGDIIRGESQRMAAERQRADDLGAQCAALRAELATFRAAELKRARQIAEIEGDL